MRKLEGEERATLYKTIGGTNTPFRRYWQEQIEARDGQRAGTSVVIGEVDDMRPVGEHRRGRTSSRPTRARYSARSTPSSTAPGSRPTSASTGCSPTCSTTAAPAATRSAGSTSSRNFEVTRHPQRQRRDVRLRQRHARRLLPGRRHVPRPADRRPGDRRRPRQAGLRKKLGPCARPVSGGSGSGTRRSDRLSPTSPPRSPPTTSERPPCSHPERPDPDPDLPAGDGRVPVDPDHHADPAHRRTLGTSYQTTFTILVAVAGARRRLGAASTTRIQQFRWEKDWPTIFGLLTAINEGLLVWLLLAGWRGPGDRRRSRVRPSSSTSSARG